MQRAAQSMRSRHWMLRGILLTALTSVVLFVSKDRALGQDGSKSSSDGLMLSLSHALMAYDAVFVIGASGESTVVRLMDKKTVEEMRTGLSGEALQKLERAWKLSEEIRSIGQVASEPALFVRVVAESRKRGVWRDAFPVPRSALSAGGDVEVAYFEGADKDSFYGERGLSSRDPLATGRLASRFVPRDGNANLPIVDRRADPGGTDPKGGFSNQLPFSIVSHAGPDVPPRIRYASRDEFLRLANLMDAVVGMLRSESLVPASLRGIPPRVLSNGTGGWLTSPAVLGLIAVVVVGLGLFVRQRRARAA